ncbi:hypothetical protein CH367_09740 [Leptospira barantonii]|uniref:Hint domain-containing protein n=2 Tax=Leptospira barantonii TaxID=2023184 RepID=A0ABX4NM03_9LEPT|nr:hypothetical protein CH367_09740 [Leptospira barantonii]
MEKDLKTGEMVFKQRTCFVAGTLVHTKDGLKKIEEIQVGDAVISWNEKTDELEFNRVVETYIRKTDRIYKLTYENGRVVETTSTHPFYIEDKGWVEAYKLLIGDKSVLSNGTTTSIASIQIISGQETVYNFQVENAHTYFVTEDGILVHNAGLGYKKTLWDGSSGEYTGKQLILGANKVLGFDVYGGKEYQERRRSDGSLEYVHITQVEGDDGKKYAHERSYRWDTSGNRYEDNYIWSGNGRNRKTDGEKTVGANGSVIYHSETKTNAKGEVIGNKLYGDNGLFTSGYISRSDYQTPDGNVRRSELYTATTTRQGATNNVSVSVTRNMHQNGIDGNFYMGAYDRTSNYNSTNDYETYRISTQEGASTQRLPNGYYPPAHINVVNDPVHNAASSYSTGMLDMPFHGERHLDRHDAIDASTNTKDIFSSRPGQIRFNDNGRNGLGVNFEGRESQLTLHTSGNASYIFPGQVVRGGEYLGRRGGMINYDDHLHQEYRGSNGQLLNTRQIMDTYNGGNCTSKPGYNYCNFVP